MGKSSKKGGSESAQKVQSAKAQVQAPASDDSTDDKEARFLAALWDLAAMGDEEQSVDNVRRAIAKLTPEQKQQLTSESSDLRKTLLTNQDLSDDRSVFFKEINQTAENAGMPIGKDAEFLAKKVCARRAHGGAGVPPITCTCP
jgi:hypothetical protein